jgi:hypothetical protein
MNLAKEIENWASRLKPWQSDILRRLFETDIDIDAFEEIQTLMRSEYGLIDPGVLLPKRIPFNRSNIGVVSEAGKTVRLVKMHSLKNVNALIEGQEIGFEKNGLTVIYGENATGKSGYSRVLKRACRARGEKQAIHPNIYISSPLGPAEATIRIGSMGIIGTATV